VKPVGVVSNFPYFDTDLTTTFGMLVVEARAGAAGTVDPTAAAGTLGFVAVFEAPEPQAARSKAPAAAKPPTVNRLRAFPRLAALAAIPLVCRDRSTQPAWGRPYISPPKRSNTTNTGGMCGWIDERI
jgi:hypothetical protein